MLIVHLTYVLGPQLALLDRGQLGDQLGLSAADLLGVQVTVLGGNVNHRGNYLKILSVRDINLYVQNGR